MKSNKALYKYMLCVLFAISSVSCVSPDPVVDGIFVRVRRLMQSRPDSSLFLLDSMGMKSLHHRGQRAEYALLYSMALDKNYIDIGNDSIISVATSWYDNHGIADDRLKAFYYEGRVMLNAGDSESALESFIEAAKYVQDAEDKYAVALLYRWMGNIYLDVYDRRALDCYEKSAEYFLESGDTGKMTMALISQHITIDILGSFMDISPYDTLEPLETVKVFLNDISDDDAMAYYHCTMTDCIERSDTSSLRHLLDDYLDRYADDPSKIGWLNVTECGVFLGDADVTWNGLSNFVRYYYINPPYDNDSTFMRSYFYLSSAYYRSVGRYDKCMLYSRRLSDMNDSIFNLQHSQDTRFLSDRSRLDRSDGRVRRNLVIVILCVGISVLSVTAVSLELKARIARRKRLRRDLDDYNDQLRSVEEKLVEARFAVKSDDAVRRRVHAIDEVIAACLQHGISSEEDVTKKIESLIGDKVAFMHDTYKIVSGKYGYVISFLKSRNLDDYELELCSLYLTGLSGRSVSSYVGTRRHNDAVASIRKKLGLSEDDTSIGRYLNGLKVSLLQS